MRRWCCALAALAAVSAGAAAEPEEVKLPEGARVALEKAEEIEVLSLDPDGGESCPTPSTNFKVLGKTTVKDETRRAVAAAVLKGVADSNGNVGRCFEPRQGLRVVYDGRVYDFVICFHCLQIRVFVGRGLLDTTPTTTSARKTLNKVLKDAGVTVEASGEK